MLQNRACANVFAAVAAMLLTATTAAAELRLMMVERPGCHWCAQWNAEIAPVYPKTPEGRSAPLLRHYIRDPLPTGVTLVSPPHFTPTFILLEDGAELGRIEGYPGEDFFWGLLGTLLAKSAAGISGSAAP